MNYTKTVVYRHRIQPIKETYISKQTGDTEQHTLIKKHEDLKPEIVHLLERKYVKPDTFRKKCKLCGDRANRKINIGGIIGHYCHRHGITVMSGLIIYKSSQQLWSRELKFYAEEETKDRSNGPE